jgi:hypothetical protein
MRAKPHAMTVHTALKGCRRLGCSGVVVGCSFSGSLCISRCVSSSLLDDTWLIAAFLEDSGSSISEFDFLLMLSFR